VNRFAFHYEKLTVSSETGKVFADPKQIRRRRLLQAVILLLVVALAWLALFLNGALSWQTAFQDVSAYWSREDRQDPLETFDRTLPPDVQLASLAAAPKRDTRCAPTEQPYFAAMADAAAPVVFAHVPSTYDWAHLSLPDSCEQIGVLVPDWLRIEADATGPALTLESAESRVMVEDFRAQSAATPDLMPTVMIDPGPQKEAFFTALSTPGTATRIASELATTLTLLYAQGACLNILDFNEADLPRLLPFFETLANRFDADGFTACLILSGTDALWRNPEATDLFDTVILKLFHEPWVGAAPAPLAPDAWFADTAKAAAETLGKDKLVVALGSFAVEWTSGVPMPRTMPYAEAMDRIAATGANLRYSAKVSGSLSSFRDANGRQHKIWMQDAASIQNQLATLTDLGIASTGIWSLGQEDPGVWMVLRNRGSSADELSAALALVQLKNFVQYSGEGAFLKLKQRLSPGIRQVRIDDETGRVTAQSYDLMPRPYALERYGKPEGKQVALTFDDGPHPEFSPQVLDILEAESVPAAFFVTGSAVMEAPDVLRRIVDEGHEIGAHTFSHPRMDQISRTRVDLEFSLLDKIIAGAVGRKAMLYREPFQRSGGPISAARVASLEPALDRGLEVVGMDIVPRDWDGWSAREIADFVISEVQNDRGNMILLHDGGKDRSATVEALPLIISGLRDTGYSFTTLANLANTTRADIMPVAEGGYQTLDRVSFSMVAWMRHAVVTAFWVALAIGITRSLAVLVLSVLNWRGRRPVSLVEPRVAVIIPAHNEEKVIRTCIESVRASDYRNLEIIVVDDGSSDNTLTEVFRFSHKQDVRLISQPNQGKWSALNRALLNVDAEIVVCIDADTQIERSAIRHLVKQFNDPKVGAVAGKIMAGNKVNLLTRLQAFEYATSQNVDRRAFDLINGILVVPGALGAWRRSALRKAGLFSDATMTEDTDLTIQVNRAGYRVVYEPRARGYTEVPERIGQLLKQRLRWSFGMFQSAWKHKRAVFEGRMVGLISIPDMFIFGYLFPLLAPIADLFVLVLLYNMVAGGWGELDTTLAAQPTHYLWAYLTLPALEILIAAFALARDEDESLWSLLLFPIHRVFYRPLLYYSVIRAILRAVTGRLASWGTQKRLGRDYSLATGGA